MPSFSLINPARFRVTYEERNCRVTSHSPSFQSNYSSYANMGMYLLASSMIHSMSDCPFSLITLSMKGYDNATSLSLLAYPKNYYNQVTSFLLVGAFPKMRNLP